MNQVPTSIELPDTDSNAICSRRKSNKDPSTKAIRQQPPVLMRQAMRDYIVLRRATSSTTTRPHSAVSTGTRRVANQSIINASPTEPHQGPAESSAPSVRYRPLDEAYNLLQRRLELLQGPVEYCDAVTVINTIILIQKALSQLNDVAVALLNP